MGRGNTKQIGDEPPPPSVPQPVAQVETRHIPFDHANDPVATLDFELSTPMLAMPFEHFKKQKRIVKSTKT